MIAQHRAGVDQELAIAKKSLDLIKEFNSAKIEVTEEQTHSHVKPRHKRAKKLCKDAKEQVVSARAHLKAERQRTFKLRQRLWELQGMEGACAVCWLCVRSVHR